MNFIKLLLLHYAVSLRLALENGLAAALYWWRGGFGWRDAYLLFSENPYRLCRREAERSGDSEVHSYGETPLLTMAKIAREAGLTKEDTLYELGCGRGRAAIWLNRFCGCHVVGIDRVREFIRRATRVAPRNVTFKCTDFLTADLSAASAIYLYGLLLSDEQLVRLTERLKSLKSGSTLISVSFPLDAPEFEVKRTIKARFTWGVADVYIQTKV